MTATDTIHCFEKAGLGLAPFRYAHPHSYRASQGETLADWARWMAETRHWGTLAATLKRALGA